MPYSRPKKQVKKEHEAAPAEPQASRGHLGRTEGASRHPEPDRGGEFDTCAICQERKELRKYVCTCENCNREIVYKACSACRQGERCLWHMCKTCMASIAPVQPGCDSCAWCGALRETGQNVNADFWCYECQQKHCLCPRCRDMQDDGQPCFLINHAFRQPCHECRDCRARIFGVSVSFSGVCRCEACHVLAEKGGMMSKIHGEEEWPEGW